MQMSEETGKPIRFVKDEVKELQDKAPVSDPGAPPNVPEVAP